MDSTGQRVRTWAAYAAAAWALIFAGQNLVAMILATSGSGFGADLFAADFVRLARDRDVGFIVTLWLAVIAKSFGVAVALAATVVWIKPTGGGP